MHFIDRSIRYSSISVTMRKSGIPADPLSIYLPTYLSVAAARPRLVIDKSACLWSILEFRLDEVEFNLSLLRPTLPG